MIDDNNEDSKIINDSEINITKSNVFSNSPMSGVKPPNRLRFRVYFV